MGARKGKPSDELERPGTKQMILGENKPTVECRQDMEIMARCHDFVERIKLGHDRLWANWARLCAVPIAERDPWIAKWDDGYDKLSRMNSRIVVAGWHWCLYLSKEKQPLYWCLVCPMDSWDWVNNCPNGTWNPERGCPSMCIEIEDNKFVYDEDYRLFIDAMKKEAN
jgi:hypothetical protein